MTQQIKVYAVLTAKPGCQERLLVLLKGMVAASRAEAGNLQYDLWQEDENPGRFVLEECYRDELSAAAHKSSPHFLNYLSIINDLAERLVVAVSRVDALERAFPSSSDSPETLS